MFEVENLSTTMQDGPADAADEVFTRPRHLLTAEYLSGARG